MLVLYEEIAIIEQLYDYVRAGSLSEAREQGGTANERKKRVEARPQPLLTDPDSIAEMRVKGCSTSST
jgi:hypothetical protein